jgi:hypothetical protein
MAIDGSFVFQPEDLHHDPMLKPQIEAWCNDTIPKDDWKLHIRYALPPGETGRFVMWFRSETDRLHFKMRWVGETEDLELS